MEKGDEEKKRRKKNSLEGILVPVGPVEPLPIEKIMAPGALGDAPDQLILVGVSDADGVVATGAQAPDHDAAHVELGAAGPPAEQAVPQAIGRVRVGRVGGEEGGAGDLD